MSNNPILLFIPNTDGEELLQSNNDELDEGETTDSEDTVDEDVREADSINEKLEE